MALLIVPSLVGRLLLGEELTGTAATVARVAGIALIGLSIACWRGPPRAGMATYGGGVALCLGYLAITGGYGLFLSKGEAGLGRGKPVFLYNLLDLKRTAWEGPELAAGKHMWSEVQGAS